MYTSIHVKIVVKLYVYMYTYTCIHVYMYTCIQVYMYTCIHNCWSFFSKSRENTMCIHKTTFNNLRDPSIEGILLPIIALI